MSRYYPVMLNIEGRLCTVVGGGSVALRKARGIAAAGGLLRVIAPELRSEFSEITGAELLRKRYEPHGIDGSFIVIAATDDRKLNERILSDAHGMGMLAMTAEGGGDFINGAVRREGAVTVQVSTGVPRLSAAVCGRLRLNACAAAAEVLARYRRGLKKEAYDRLLSEEALSVAETDKEEYEKLAKTEMEV